MKRTCSSKAEYLEGVERARAEGLIVDLGGKVEDIVHGHLTRGLMWQNTRCGDLAVRTLVDMAGQGAQVLELGQGAGVLASSIKSHFSEVQIDTVGLEPINPYLKFADWCAFADSFGFIGAGFAWGKIRERWCFSNKLLVDNVLLMGETERKDVCDLDTFFRLHCELSSSALTYVDSPIVQRQFVGCLDEAGFSQLGNYNLAIDMMGPIDYSDDFFESIRSVLEHVMPGGALIATINPLARFQDRVDGFTTDPVVVYSRSYGLFLKEGHPLYGIAKSVAFPGGACFVRDLDKWIKEASAISTSWHLLPSALLHLLG